MNKAIGIRLDQETLDKIKKLSKEESLDRSTVLRKLVMVGYRDLIKRKAAQDYIKGKITMSQAAHIAELTVWEMEQYLVEEGYKSSYSIEDLNKELIFITFLAK